MYEAQPKNVATKTKMRNGQTIHVVDSKVCIASTSAFRASGKLASDFKIRHHSAFHSGDASMAALPLDCSAALTATKTKGGRGGVFDAPD